MYTMNTSTGTVIRDADGVQVAPGQDADDEAFLEYCAWVSAGNNPTEIDVPVASSSRKITKLAFRNRFTTTEKVMLELASLDNPDAAMQARQVAAMVRVYLKDLDNASYIDLDRPDTAAGIDQLVLMGIVTPERKAIILNSPIQDVEIPT